MEATYMGGPDRAADHAALPLATRACTSAPLTLPCAESPVVGSGCWHGDGCARRRPAPPVATGRRSPVHPLYGSPTPVRGCRTRWCRRIPPRRPRAPGRRRGCCPHPGRRRRVLPSRCARPSSRPAPSVPPGATSSDGDGANSASCSRRNTSPEGVRLPFITRESMAELMPARRAASFWLMWCASIRSHRTLGSTLEHWADSVFTGASRTDSIRAWAAGLRLRRPRDTRTTYP